MRQYQVGIKHSYAHWDINADTPEQALWQCLKDHSLEVGVFMESSEVYVSSLMSDGDTIFRDVHIERSIKVIRAEIEESQTKFFDEKIKEAGV